MNAETRAHIVAMKRSQALAVADAAVLENRERLQREFRAARHQERPEARPLTFRPFAVLARARKARK